MPHTTVTVGPDEVDIRIVRGTDNSIDFILLNNLDASGGTPLDITNDTVKFTARADFGEGSTVKIPTKTNGPGQHEDPVNGRTQFTIARTEIDGEADEDQETVWFYEVRRIAATTLTQNVHLQGKLLITPAVVQSV